MLPSTAALAVGRSLFRPARNLAPAKTTYGINAVAATGGIRLARPASAPAVVGARPRWKSVSAGGKNNTNFDASPSVKFDPTNPPSALHEKAAKAAKLHDELNSLLAARAQRKEIEDSRHFGAGFLDFLKRSKGEVINIIAAFACVCLAYQISAMRRAGRKLLDEAEERKAELEGMRRLLRSLGENDLAERVGRKCAEALSREDDVVEGDGGAAEGRTGGLLGWINGGRRRSSAEEASKDPDEVRSRIAAVVTTVVAEEIRAAVGDAAYTEDEMKERRFEEIRTIAAASAKGEQEAGSATTSAEFGAILEAATSSSSAGAGGEGAAAVFGNAVEVETAEDENANVVKKRKFVI